MKNLLFAALLVFSFTAIAQETEFKFTKDQIVKAIVIETPGKSAQDLYKLTKQWVSTYYKSPVDVLKGDIENDYIRVNGASDQLVCFNMMGKNCYPAFYQVEIAFKDGKYRMEIIDLTFSGSQSDPNIPLDNPKDYFKPSGQVKGNYKFFPTMIPKYFNDLNADLKKFIDQGGVKKEW